MKILILTGGFHSKMPLEELRALGMKINMKDGRIVVGEAQNVEKLKRLGYSHLVLEYLGSFCMNERLPFDPEKYIEGKFAARFKNLGFSGKREKKKEEILEELNPNIKAVDLNNPDTTFYFLMKGEKIYVGKLIHRFDPTEFTERKSEFKPYSRPVSLLPREARCWINLSGVEGDLLDPFCGTGTILVEAGLAGYNVYGSDSEDDMVSGSIMNMEYYEVEGEVRKSKIQNLSKNWDRAFDVVVTDPPYGRSAKVCSDKIENLYRFSLKEIESILKSNGRCVIGCPRKMGFDKILKETDSKFKVLNKFTERVHGDLQREIFVLGKK